MYDVTYEEWVNALKSGNYQQGFGHDVVVDCGNVFACAFGVAGLLVVDDNIDEIEFNFISETIGEYDDSEIPIQLVPNSSNRQLLAMDLNDEMRLSLPDIGFILEKHAALFKSNDSTMDERIEIRNLARELKENYNE